MLALLAVLAVATAQPKVYDAHPGKAHDEKAAAWFLEDPGTAFGAPSPRARR